MSVNKERVWSGLGLALGSVLAALADCLRQSPEEKGSVSMGEGKALRLLPFTHLVPHS